MHCIAPLWYLLQEKENKQNLGFGEFHVYPFLTQILYYSVDVSTLAKQAKNDLKRYQFWSYIKCSINGNHKHYH